MRKLRLDISALEVDSFVVGKGRDRSGTVEGQDDDTTTDCTVTESNDEFCVGTLVPGPQGCHPTAAPQRTCYDTCGSYTCDGGLSCYQTCQYPACQSNGFTMCDPTCMNEPGCPTG